MEDREEYDVICTSAAWTGSPPWTDFRRAEPIYPAFFWKMAKNGP